MQKAFLFFALCTALLATSSVVAWAQDANNLDLSLEDEELATKDTTNQSFSVVPQEGRDKNMDYSEAYEDIEIDALPKRVRLPALGTRGYRPNLLGVGYGERVPGVGAFLDYSFNRLGIGIATSVRQNADKDWQNFTSLYATYHMLPFAVTPYLIMGGGYTYNAPTALTVLAGIGLEAGVWDGLTFSGGYTYFSSVNKGFLGGSVGWAF